MKRRCDVCGSLTSAPLYRQRFATVDDWALFDGYEVAACSQCSFVYAEDVPSQAAFDAYYGATSTEGTKYASGVEGVLAPWAVENYRTIVDGIAARFPNRAARILDVGSASGHLLAAFQNAGYPNVTGFDPSPGAAEIARSRYGIEVLTRPISRMPFEGQRFDLVLLAGVIEHLRDLKPTLTRLVELLERDGMIWFEMPDATRFEDFVSAPFQQFSLEHINFFTPASLTSLLAAVGYAPVSIWERIAAIGEIRDPGIDALFVRTSALPKAIAPDHAGAAAVRSYIQASEELEHRLIASIAPLVAAQTPVILWGTGTLTLHLLCNPAFSCMHIAAFTDRNPQFHGKTIRGIPILAPAAVHALDATIVVVSRSYEAEIGQAIRNQYGLANPIWPLFERAQLRV